jgi:2'-5' RNA ligase
MIVVVPPKLISEEIIGFQKEIEVKYGAIHAQNVVPHITIIPPFDCEQEKCEEFISSIMQFISSKESILEIHLDNFQQFDMKTLIVDIAKNVSFERWCKELKLLFNQHKLIKQRVEKHFFVPHITIANKDIKKSNFKLAWLEFKHREFQAKFKLENLSILVKNEKWETFDNLELKKN